MKYHVFISYAHEDGEIAASVATALSDLGLKPFLAEKDLVLGMNWEVRLRDALMQSHIVLCLITERSKRSVWVHAEAGAAWALDKPIVPALFAVDPNELMDILRLRHGGKVASPESLQDLLDNIAALVRRSSMTVDQPPKRASRAIDGESFTSEIDWENLLKVGTWTRDQGDHAIRGGGMHNYLLSARQYDAPFVIDASITFEDLHPTDIIDAVNAGIVFGWTTPRHERRYFNVLMNERRLLLELIGDQGGNAYEDYRHLDDGIPFSLLPHVRYDVRIQLTPTSMAAMLRSEQGQSWSYTTALEESPLGRVGLRPWRSRMVCHTFSVRPTTV
jgi:TIR domain